MGFLTDVKSYGSAKAPDILYGVGIAGVCFTAYSSVRAGIKIAEAKAEYRSNLEQIDNAVSWRENGEIDPETPYTVDDEEADRKSARKAYALSVVKALSIPAASASATVACFTCAVGNANAKTAKAVATANAAAAAVNKLTDFINNYRSRVIDEEGATKDMHYALGIPEKEITVTEKDENGKSKKVKKTVLDVKSEDDLKNLDLSPYQLVWGPYKSDGQPNHNFTGNRNLDVLFLETAQNNAESWLQRKGYLRLSWLLEKEFCEEKSGIGTLGWIRNFYDESSNPKFGRCRDGHVNFRIKPIDIADGALTIYLLDFNCDGDIERLISEAKKQNAAEVGVTIRR